MKLSIIAFTIITFSINDNQHYDIQHNNTQQNETRHKRRSTWQCFFILLSVIYAKCHLLFIVMLNVTMLNATMPSVLAPSSIPCLFCQTFFSAKIWQGKSYFFRLKIRKNGFQFTNMFKIFLKCKVSYYESDDALCCHRCLINTGVEKNEQHLNID